MCVYVCKYLCVRACVYTPITRYHATSPCVVFCYMLTINAIIDSIVRTVRQRCFDGRHSFFFVHLPMKHLQPIAEQDFCGQRRMHNNALKTVSSASNLRITPDRNWSTSKYEGRYQTMGVRGQRHGPLLSGACGQPR